MLRQALDDAARGQKIDRPEHESRGGPTERDSLLQPGNPETVYASASSQNPELDASETLSYNDDDEVEYLVQDWHDEDSESIFSNQSFLDRTWKAIKSCFVLVVNVENLWDSPSQNAAPDVSRRNHYIVFFWFFILATSYASERSTFKLLVDRTGPFRLFAVQMVTFTHAMMLGLGMLLSAVSRKDFTIQPLGIPVVDVGLMALLDTVHLLLVFLTGPHVAPTLTVILVQFTLPLTAIITQFVHSDGCVKRCCSPTIPSDSRPSSDGSHLLEGRSLPGRGGLSIEHVWGSTIILLAVLLALCPVLYSIIDPDFFIYADAIPIQTCYNTILFVSSCIPAAASQLYKEHVFLQYKQPVQANLLNFILSVFQLIFASIMSPLVYTLLGLKASKDWTKLYPSSGFSKNVMEAAQCFTEVLDEERAKDGYMDEAKCDYSLLLVLLHSFSIISVGLAVDKIVNAGATKVMYRGVSAGIIVSVISLYAYDLTIPDFSYGPAIDSLNLVSVLLLVIGSEVYHRVSLQDATFETTYPEVENFYDDIE